MRHFAQDAGVESPIIARLTKRRESAVGAMQLESLRAPESGSACRPPLVRGNTVAIE